MSARRKDPSSERTPLLPAVNSIRRMSRLQQQDEASSYIESHVTKEEQALSGSTIGERLPYNDYTTIDFLHDLVCSQLLSRARVSSLISSQGQRLLSLQAGP